MLKVYIYIEDQSDIAIGRVVSAFQSFSPLNVSFVNNFNDADFVILNVTGRRDAIRAKADRAIRKSKKFAVIQYCVRSTQKANTWEWVDIWNDAELVWSYYDLYKLCSDDGVKHNFGFYYAPLGVSSTFSKRYFGEKLFTVMTSGKAWTTESVREAGQAAGRIKGRVLHLGGDMKRHHIIPISGVSDVSLSYLYGTCYYVAGLRRVEGFELPVIEGLVCGARPIVYNKPHYRKWFDNWAVFIEENGRENIIDSLENVFLGEYNSVSNDEIRDVKEFFDWGKIIDGFWRYIL